jgi:hypothetical protein
MPVPANITEKRAFLERNLRITLMMGDNDPEVKKLTDKILDLKHEFRDGHLFVGSEIPAKWEVRKSKTGTVYCKCPAFAFRQRPGRGDGLCKHILYAMASDTEIPATEDFAPKK